MMIWIVLYKCYIASPLYEFIQHENIQFNNYKNNNSNKLYFNNQLKQQVKSNKVSTEHTMVMQLTPESRNNW